MPKKISRQTRAKLALARSRFIFSTKLRQIIREATKTGATEAIEHCGNFWGVSDDYKKFIERRMEEHAARIEEQAAALMVAVKTEIRRELNRQFAQHKRPKRRSGR